jgi:hypothetical protein
MTDSAEKRAAAGELWIISLRSLKGKKSGKIDDHRSIVELTWTAGNVSAIRRAE